MLFALRNPAYIAEHDLGKRRATGKRYRDSRC